MQWRRNRLNNKCFLLFSNAGRAQRRYLAVICGWKRLVGYLGVHSQVKLIKAYTQGRIARDTKLGYDSGFLKAEGAFSVIRQRLIRLLRCNFLYSPKAHTIIALPFSVISKNQRATSLFRKTLQRYGKFC